jgi:hypothetical protein
VLKPPPPTETPERALAVFAAYVVVARVEIALHFLGRKMQIYRKSMKQQRVRMMRQRCILAMGMQLKEHDSLGDAVSKIVFAER